jgi:signal transduction histidine kinase
VQRKDVEEQIKQQNIQLKKLDELKTSFLNITTHELRTPMASIKGYIQMLLKQGLGEISEEQRKALEVILRNTNRLDYLLRDILDVSRLESGTMKFISEKTNPRTLINESIDIMRPYLDQKAILTKVFIGKKLPPLFLDKERIKQVITNLIQNAIKFSPDDSIINIKAKKQKENILFEIQDFGRGISKDKQEKIFDLFFQIDNGLDRKFGGVGLGLTISKGIILSHGGKIWVESKEGKGSTFKFTIPINSVKDMEKKFKEADIFVSETM